MSHGLLLASCGKWMVKVISHSGSVILQCANVCTRWHYGTYYSASADHFHFRGKECGGDPHDHKQLVCLDLLLAAQKKKIAAVLNFKPKVSHKFRLIPSVHHHKWVFSHSECTTEHTQTQNQWKQRWVRFKGAWFGCETCCPCNRSYCK